MPSPGPGKLTYRGYPPLAGNRRLLLPGPDEVTELRQASERLAARERQQAVVARLGLESLGEPDLQSFMDRALHQVWESLGADYCELLELQPDGKTLCLRAGVGWREGLVGSAQVQTDLDPQAGFTLLCTEPVIVADLATKKRFSPPSLLMEHGVASRLSCLVRDARGVYGVLGAHAKERRGFTAEDVNFVQAVASLIGCAIVRLRAEELRELAAVAESSHNELLAMLSHELRNPLAAVRSAAEVLKLRPGERSVVARAQTIIARQAGHMAKLLDGLLDVSRLVRGHVVLEPEVLDLVAICRIAVTDAEERATTRRLALRFDFPPQPVWVKGDPVRLSQVVDRLLSNAVKYSDEGGTIQLSVASERDRAVLEVRDNGAGIDPARMPDLFEVFRRASGSPERSDGGLGLGLPLVKSLVELHGGGVEANSPGPGHGAVFVVRLPLTGERPPPQETPMSAPGRSRILIVEDNEDAARALQEMLELAGHEVWVATCGERGVSMARERRPDVVLCDLGLPDDMTGADVARALRGEPDTRAIRLVALSGYGRPEDKTRSADAGFDAHITKPVDLDGLNRILAELRRGEAPKAGGEGEP